MTDITFADLGLAEPLARALAARGHEIPTPIQAQSIPTLLEGRDLMGIAQTGTGKTGAFSLPMLHKLSQPAPAGEAPRNRAIGGPRALILAPTRELAAQIGDELRAYGKFLKLRHTVIFGGVKQGGQVKALSRGVDIVVATPGRLIDLMEQGALTLSTVEYLVLDEADRMLDMGFVHDVRKIVAAVPKKRQTLFFSATMAGEAARLSADILKDPTRVEVTPQAATVDRIKQTVRHVPATAKREALMDLLADPALSRVILFTRTKHRANRVAEQLEKSGVPSDAIHGNKSQNARVRALERFRKGNARVLVATDIAARGIDVDGVTHVINFELPNEPESYVHRIGRTARAGAEGEAISLCDADERGYLRDIERLIRMKLEVVGDAPAEDRPGGRQESRRRGGGGGGQPSGAPGRSRGPRRRRRGGNGGAQGARSAAGA